MTWPTGGGKMTFYSGQQVMTPDGELGRVLGFEPGFNEAGGDTGDVVMVEVVRVDGSAVVRAFDADDLSERL